MILFWLVAYDWPVLLQHQRLSSNSSVSSSDILTLSLESAKPTRRSKSKKCLCWTARLERCVDNLIRMQLTNCFLFYHLYTPRLRSVLWQNFCVVICWQFHKLRLVLSHFEIFWTRTIFQFWYCYIFEFCFLLFATAVIWGGFISAFLLWQFFPMFTLYFVN